MISGPSLDMHNVKGLPEDWHRASCTGDGLMDSITYVGLVVQVEASDVRVET